MNEALIKCFLRQWADFFLYLVAQESGNWMEHSLAFLNSFIKYKCIINGKCQEKPGTLISLSWLLFLVFTIVHFTEGVWFFTQSSWLLKTSGEIYSTKYRTVRTIESIFWKLDCSRQLLKLFGLYKIEPRRCGNFYETDFFNCKWRVTCSESHTWIDHFHHYQHLSEDLFLPKPRTKHG